MNFDDFCFIFAPSTDPSRGYKIINEPPRGVRGFLSTIAPLPSEGVVEKQRPSEGVVERGLEGPKLGKGVERGLEAPKNWAQPLYYQKCSKRSVFDTIP